MKSKARPPPSFVPFPRLKKIKQMSSCFGRQRAARHHPLRTHSLSLPPPPHHTRPPASIDPPTPIYAGGRPAAVTPPPALPEPAGGRSHSLASCCKQERRSDPWPRSPPAPASAAPAPRLPAGSRAARAPWSPAGGPPRASAPLPPPRRPRLPSSSRARSKNNDLAKLVIILQLAADCD